VIMMSNLLLLWCWCIICVVKYCARITGKKKFFLSNKVPEFKSSELLYFLLSLQKMQP
jgi:hypothetical protein